MYWIYILTLKLESQKAFGQQYKSQQDQETHYTSACTKCEEFIVIDKVMDAEEVNFYVSLELLWQGIKSVTLVYLGEMSPSHWGWIQIVLIWTLIMPIVVK